MSRTEVSTSDGKLVSLVQVERSSVVEGLRRVLFLGSLYTCTGLLVYHFVDGWDGLDALYFSVIALSTVGYGDLVPKTEAERLFTSFFLIIGFLAFGAFVSMQVTILAEHTEHMAKERSLRAAKTFSKHSRYQSGVIARLLSRVSVDNINPFRTRSRAAGNSTATGGSGSHVDEIPPSHPEGGVDMAAFLLNSYDEDLLQLRDQALVNILLLTLAVVIGLLSMQAIEGWTSPTSFYWACQTITTVGFGDVVPKTARGKVFTIFFVLFGCGLLAKAVTDFIKYPLLLRARRHEQRVLEQFSNLTEEKLNAVFKSEFFLRIPGLRRSSAEISKAEFTLLALQMMSKVEDKDIFLVASLFDKLDSSGEGILSQEIMQQRLQEAQDRDREVEAERLRKEREREQQKQQGGQSTVGEMIDMIENVIYGAGNGSEGRRRGSSSIGLWGSPSAQRDSPLHHRDSLTANVDTRVTGSSHVTSVRSSALQSEEGLKAALLLNSRAGSGSDC